MYVKVIQAELAEGVQSHEFDVLKSSSRLKVNSLAYQKFVGQLVRLEANPHHF